MALPEQLPSPSPSQTDGPEVCRAGQARGAAWVLAGRCGGHGATSALPVSVSRGMVSQRRENKCSNPERGHQITQRLLSTPPALPPAHSSSSPVLPSLGHVSLPSRARPRKSTTSYQSHFVFRASVSHFSLEKGGLGLNSLLGG